MSNFADTARRLRDAYAGKTLEPLRSVLAPDDADGAYEIQAINTRYWREQGRRVVGKKIGLTSPAVQKQLGVDQPDFGVLFEDMQIADGGRLDPARALQPKAEAEVAIIVGRDLPNGVGGIEDMLAAADCAVAAIEIVDSRISDWRISFADTVADNGSSAFFVLGTASKGLEGLDLYSCGMVLEINGAVASLGTGAACLGHPLKAAAWLANMLAMRGEPLVAGDILLTGALGPMVSLTPGDRVSATIGGLGTCRFAYDGA